MSVQAVIAQLNQQSNSTDIQPNFKRSSSRLNSTFLTNNNNNNNNSNSNSKNELASIRNRFNINNNNNSINNNNSNNKNSNEFLKKAASSLKEVNNNNNKYIRSSEKVLNTESKDLPLEKMKTQLEKITLERDSLKQQLTYCHLNHTSTPCDSGLTLSHDPLWFEIEDEKKDEDHYEDVITQYYQSCSNHQYRQQIDQLKRQLAACEIGTQWMMGKYLGELERERLHTKSLKTIVQSQETLINTMENNYKHTSSSSSSSSASTTLSNSFSTNSMNSIHSSLSSSHNNHHYQQQYFLLRSQVDLQKMELDDKQDMIHMLMDEREFLLRKLNNNKSPSCSSMKRRSRVISTSSSLSSDSTNIIQQQHQQLPYHILTSSSSPIRPYSPPQTPPPFDRLPALPTSTSISSTLSSTSTTPMTMTPPSSQRPSMITFDHKPIVHEYENDQDHVDHVDHHLQHPQRYSSLLHKSSMPDIRSIHYSALNSPRTSLGSHPSMDPYLLSKKSLSRQRSFWKGWKQRLSN
ncbi:unnamed protein product [Cunninghamella blakesleeana]